MKIMSHAGDALSVCSELLLKEQTKACCMHAPNATLLCFWQKPKKQGAAQGWMTALALCAAFSQICFATLLCLCSKV